MHALCSLLAAATLPAVSAAMLGAQTMSSAAGRLLLDPVAPRAGTSIHIVYRPVPELAHEAALHLRARLRTAQDESYNGNLGSRTVAVLERTSDGSFRGTWTLPGEMVYATLAVEEPTAARIDRNGGAFWELLVYGEDGRPLFESLDQRFNDFMGRDQREVLETARRMTSLYPERVQGWSMLRAAEGWTYGDAGQEERRVRHRARLQALDATLATAGAPAAGQVEMMYWYAVALDDSATAARWRERLLREAPQSWFVLQERLAALRREHAAAPAVLLAALDSLWAAPYERQARNRLASLAFGTARQAGNADALRTWGARLLEVGASEQSVAAALAAVPATRAEGIERLAPAITALEEARDTQRELGATGEQHRRDARLMTAARRSTLGRALVQAGRIRDALPVLEQAAAASWVTERYRTLGEARLAAGDTAGAAAAFAAAAADPATPPGSADSLRAAVGLDAAAWHAAVGAARTRMTEQTLALASVADVPAAAVTLADGARVPLQQRFGARATVVVFWSRYCGFSVEAMPGIAAAAARLAADGVPLLAITADGHAEAEAFLEAGGYSLAVLYDTGGEAARALGSWGTPEYFVIDGQGRRRFQSSLDSLLREVVAVLAEAGGAQPR